MKSVPANGTVGFVPFANLGKAIECKIVNQTETPVIVGQVLQVSDTINCFNPNTANEELPFTYVFQMPPNSFGILANSTTVSLITNTQPIVATGLQFSGNMTYIPLTSTYGPLQNKTFFVKYKIQPLAITYSPYNPGTVYAGQPALSLINVTLSNDADIPIYNASYYIPLQYGLNASFVLNNTVVSREQIVKGAYPVTFTNVPADSTYTGTIYYYTPTIQATSLAPYSIYENNTQYLYFPFYLHSVDPLPISSGILLANTTYNGTAMCGAVSKVYIASSPNSINGTVLNYTCLDNYAMIKIDTGSYTLGQSKYVIVKTNPLLKAYVVVGPSGNIFAPIVSFFEAIGRDIISFFAEILKAI